MANVGIIDYGMGNLHSVEKALQKCGAATRLITEPDAVKTCERIVVPGVGAFGDAVANLLKTQLWDALNDYFASGRPVLGICLGMQVLLERSTEKGTHTGFGLVTGEVVRFPDEVNLEGVRDCCYSPRATATSRLKVPQIGWNQVEFAKPAPLFDGIPDKSYFYFVHSYYASARNSADVIAQTEYGLRYACAVAKGNVFGVQFHPEKSQKWGLKLLENFLKIG